TVRARASGSCPTGTRRARARARSLRSRGADRRQTRPCAIMYLGLTRRPEATSMLDHDTWELLSYIVTAVGLPCAIFVFLFEQKKERDSDEEEVYQLLSDNYQDFLKVALDNPDLRMFSSAQTPDLTAEQRERMLIIFNMLISLFERAYILLYEESMSAKQA